MSPTIGIIERSVMAGVIRSTAEELRHYAETAQAHPAKLNALDAARMSALAQALANRANLLHYLMSGNPRPLRGELPDSGETKIIPLPHV